MKRVFPALLVALLLAACGDDNNGTPNTNNQTTTSNNGTTATNNGTVASNNGTSGSNNGTTGTTGTNNASNNGTTGTNNQTVNNTTPINNANPGVEVTETEPNNDEGTATLFMPNDTLIGSTDAMDNDFFAIDLVAGSLFEVEMTEIELLGEMYVDLIDVAQNVPDRTAGASEGDTRQFFIPVSGRYVLRLTDLTATSGAYKITTRVVAPQATTTANVPGFEDGDLDDYAVDIYSYTAGSTATVRAGVTADRSPVSSDMDAMLMVYRPGAGLVAVNDDLGNGTVDPELTFEQLDGTTYWLVVDAVYLESGGNNAYQLASEIQ